MGFEERELTVARFRFAEKEKLHHEYVETVNESIEWREGLLKKSADDIKVQRAELATQTSDFQQYKEELLDIEEERHKRLALRETEVHSKLEAIRKIEKLAAAVCTICETNPRNGVYYPCGHVVSFE